MKALWSDRRGVAAIEFAVISPVLFGLIVGAADLGRMFYVRETLEYATGQAARYYSMNNSLASTTITTYLQCQMGGNKDPACTVPGGMGPSVRVSYVDTTNCNGNSGVICTAITAQYTFTFIAGFLGFSAKTLQSQATAVRYGS